MSLSERSVGNLADVHPDLVRVVYRAAEISPIQFIVTEGRRTAERQKKLKEAGASQTLRSRHVAECNACKLSCAVDLAAVVDGEVRWDWPLYRKLADTMKEAAQIEKVSIEWGGDWISFKDGPHFQLPTVKYPYA